MIYIASPYTDIDKHVEQLRYEQVCAYAAHLFNHDQHAFSVIVHCHPISLKYEMPTTYDFWYSYCHKMITLCECVHVLKLNGWQQSVGVTGEIEIARQLNKPIVEIDPLNV